MSILLGLYLVFKGKHRSREVIGLAFGYSTFIIILAYLYNNTSLADASYLIAFLAGFMVGYYAYMNLADLFVATLGALVGCLIALILISIFSITNDLVVYLLILVGIFIGFTGHFITQEVELIMSVIVGAYLVTEGLSAFLGGLPSLVTGIQDMIAGS